MNGTSPDDKLIKSHKHRKGLLCRADWAVASGRAEARAEASGAGGAGSTVTSLYHTVQHYYLEKFVF
jgi:hypothetical protein